MKFADKFHLSLEIIKSNRIYSQNEEEEMFGTANFRGFLQIVNIQNLDAEVHQAPQLSQGCNELPFFGQKCKTNIAKNLDSFENQAFVAVSSIVYSLEFIRQFIPESRSYW